MLNSGFLADVHRAMYNHLVERKARRNGNNNNNNKVNNNNNKVNNNNKEGFENGRQPQTWNNSQWNSNVDVDVDVDTKSLRMALGLMIFIIIASILLFLVPVIRSLYLACVCNNGKQDQFLVEIIILLLVAPMWIFNVIYCFWKSANCVRKRVKKNKRK